MANTRQRLGEAFELIKQERLDEAIRVVKPITDAEPQNADAWWLLANASSEPRDARRALVTVLKINPSYPKARDLLDRLNEMFPPRDDELMMMLDIQDVEVPLPGAAPSSTEFTLDDLDEEEPPAVVQPARKAPKTEIEDLFGAETANENDNPFAYLLEEDDDLPVRSSGGGGRRLLGLVALILLVCLVGSVAFVLLNGGDEEPAPVVAEDPGDITGVTPETVNAERAVELEALRQAVEAEARLVLNNNQASAIFIQQDAGYALVMRTCSDPGPVLPQLALNGMQAISGQIAGVPAVQGDIAAVGITIQECTNEADTLYRALSPTTAAVEFNNNAQGADPQQAFTSFQAAWDVQN